MSKFSHEFFQPFRQKTDPVADKVVAKIIGRSSKEVSELFHTMTKNRDIDTVKLPEEVKAYFEDHKQMPDWADHNKLHAGQKFYADYGVEISMLLFFLSLPATYTCWRGATVLHETSRMMDPTNSTKRMGRRLMETAQFVVDTMSPKGFEENGQAIVSALKIRLIHAAIRHFIGKSDDFDTDKLGQPINQMDMAGTLMSFSALILNGLLRMGANLSEEEIEGYFHCWQVAGHFVGLDPALIPANYKEGIEMGFAIIDDQKGKSVQGNELLKALVDYANDMLPGKLFDQYIPVFLIKYFMDENLKGHFDYHIKPGLGFYVFEFFFKIILFFWKLFKRTHSSTASWRFARLRQRFLVSMLNHFNDTKQIEFDIPPSLKENWLENKKGDIIGVTVSS